MPLGPPVFAGLVRRSMLRSSSTDSILARTNLNAFFSPSRLLGGMASIDGAALNVFATAVAAVSSSAIRLASSVMLWIQVPSLTGIVLLGSVEPMSSASTVGISRAAFSTS